MAVAVGVMATAAGGYILPSASLPPVCDGSMGQPPLSPGRGCAACAVLEDAVEVGARREAALGRDDIIAVVGVVAHHLLRRLEPYLAQPYTERQFQVLLEVAGKLCPRDEQHAREGEHVGIAVAVALVLAPFVQALGDDALALGRQGCQIVGGGCWASGAIGSGCAGRLLVIVDQLFGGHVVETQVAECQDKEEYGEQDDGGVDDQYLVEEDDKGHRHRCHKQHRHARLGKAHMGQHVAGGEGLEQLAAEQYLVRCLIDAVGYKAYIEGKHHIHPHADAHAAVAAVAYGVAHDDEGIKPDNAGDKAAAVVVDGFDVVDGQSNQCKARGIGKQIEHCTQGGVRRSHRQGHLRQEVGSQYQHGCKQHPARLFITTVLPSHVEAAKAQ